MARIDGRDNDKIRNLVGNLDFDFPVMQNLSIARPVVDQRLKSRFFIPSAPAPTWPVDCADKYLLFTNFNKHFDWIHKNAQL